MVRVTMTVSVKGYRTLTFVVVDARIDARLWFFENRASVFRVSNFDTSFATGQL